MDTVEELNGTYFYAGKSNLKAGELFFMIFCEHTANQLGVQDFGAIVSIVTGLNILSVSGKPKGAVPDTSLASRGARKIFGNAKFPRPMRLPTIVGGYPPSTLRISMTNKLGAFAGRAVPVVGWTILASDVSEITYKSVRDYNRIARAEDRIW